MNKVVSIIVPVYNVEAYLKDCINSLIAQTYKNIEIILIDDGSSDSSGLICDYYKEKDERIKVIHKTNGGLSDARNSGIEVAIGEMIAFVDSDDVVCNDFVEYLVCLMLSEQSDISGCRYNRMEENGHIINENKNYQEVLINGNNNCMKHLLSDDAIDTMACGKLYKIELFKKIRFPVGKYHEDVYTTYKVIAQCNKIIIGAEIKYNYRQRQNSIVNQQFTAKHLDAIEANIERKDYVAEHYPELYDLACMGIVYAANFCVLKIIQGRNKCHEEIKYIQAQYRKYGGSYIKLNNHFTSRWFMRFARINLSVLIKIAKVFRVRQK